MAAIFLQLVLLAILGAPSLAAGAFGRLWLVDFRRLSRVPAPFHIHDDAYGDNQFAMITSHPSQYWFEVYALWVPCDMDNEADLSDIYVRARVPQRRVRHLGFYSFLLIIATLMPYFLAETVPWHELYVQSNDYDGETGCRVTIRSHLWPTIWWLRIDVEISIPRGRQMLSTFKTIRLPRLLIGSLRLGRDINYAAWKPFYQAQGPRFFHYVPHTDRIIQNLNSMYTEERIMSEADPYRRISGRKFDQIVRAYSREYEEGRYLTTIEKVRLSCYGRSVL